MRETMKQQYGLIRRPWSVFYLKNKIIGFQTRLKANARHNGFSKRRANWKLSQP